MPDAPNPFDDLRSEIPGFGGYDALALEQYETLSFYFAQRKQMPQPLAATATCENFGHDAPRGQCRRCGLGVELGGEAEKLRARERLIERTQWLRNRRQ